MFMKTYAYTILIHPVDPDEGGFWVEVPALPGCFTQGETVEDCVERAHEAIACYIEGLLKDGEPVPLEPQPTIQPTTSLRISVPVATA